MAANIASPSDPGAGQGQLLCVISQRLAILDSTDSQPAHHCSVGWTEPNRADAANLDPVYLFVQAQRSLGVWAVLQCFFLGLWLGQKTYVTCRVVQTSFQYHLCSLLCASMLLGKMPQEVNGEMFLEKRSLFQSATTLETLADATI